MVAQRDFFDGTHLLVLDHACLERLHHLDFLESIGLRGMMFELWLEENWRCLIVRVTVLFAIV